MKRLPVALALVFPTVLSLILPRGALAAYWTHMDGYAITVGRDEASHVRHLLASRDAIYALNIDHKLLRFPYDGSPATAEALPGRVVDISVAPNGQLWVVTVEPLSHNIFVLTRIQDGEDPKRAVSAYANEYPRWTISPPLALQKSNNAKMDNESVYTIAAGTKYTFVLTDSRLATLDQSTGDWKTTTLDHPFDLHELENPISLVEDDRWVWYGTDAGEWGGHLIMADARTGETSEPWNSDPVTAIVPATGAEHCVLFTVGLAHLGMTEGGIYKTCGDKPESTFSGQEPIWDLVSSNTGLFALSQGSLVPLKNAKPDFDTKINFPSKIDQSVAGLPAHLESGILVLYSGARWEVSTSGLTPYAVNLPSDAKINFQPYPPTNLEPTDCIDTHSAISAFSDSHVYLSTKLVDTLANGQPGLQLMVDGWEPGGEIAVYALDSACRIVAITSTEHAQLASSDGKATIPIPYEMRGLHPGKWVILVSGTPGMRDDTIFIPKVIYPGENGNKWRLDFDVGNPAVKGSNQQ